MGMDSSDFRLVQEIKTVNENMLREMSKLTEAARAATEAQRAGDKKLAEAFNRMAAAVEGLAREVKGLRDDLSPAIDKKNLPHPKKQP